MTKAEVIQFYREKGQLGEMTDLYLEILDAVRDAAAVHMIINEEPVPDLIILILDLKKSHIELINEKEDRWYLVYDVIYDEFRKRRLVSENVDILVSEDPGKHMIDIWDEGDERKIENLMLEIGEWQERIDRRHQEWEKYKKRV